MNISAKDFLNGVQRELYLFVRDYLDRDVYICFSYDEVQRTFESANEDRPVIHFSILESPTSAITGVTEEADEGEKVYMQYAVYVVVDENYESNKPRYMVLNSISSELKYLFDNEKDKIPKFRRLDFEIDSFLSRNPDNLYAFSNMLTFNIIKTLKDFQE